MKWYATILLPVCAAAAHAQSDDTDAVHRADRAATERLNRQALQDSRPHLSYDAQADRDYQSAHDRYARELAAWRERVAACRAGDWSACR